MLAAAAVAAACAVAVLCALVDPWRVLGTPGIPGLSIKKPEAVSRPRLAKPYLVERLRPATLVLGSSSASLGFDPADPSWPPDRRPVFNLGIDGAQPAVQHRFLQHALATSRPGLVVLATSFEDTLRGARGVRLSAADRRMYAFQPRMRVLEDGTPNPGHLRAVIEDTVFALFSGAALRDSIATVLAQRGRWTDDLGPAGFGAGAAMRRWAETDGPRAAMAHKETYDAGRLLRTRERGLWDLDGLAAMVRDARATGAEVVVLIMPAYIDQLELRRQTGLDPEVSRWRAELLHAAAGSALWDFSTPSPWTTETLPPAAVRTPLRWFWDTAHVRPELGGLMIARILGAGPAGFGEQLTAATLDAAAERHARALDAWEATHPDDVARLVALLRLTARRGPD